MEWVEEAKKKKSVRTGESVCSSFCIARSRRECCAVILPYRLVLKRVRWQDGTHAVVLHYMSHLFCFQNAGILTHWSGSMLVAWFSVKKTKKQSKDSEMAILHGRSICGISVLNGLAAN